MHRLDPGIWEGTRSATGLKEAPFQYLLPSQQLPELAEPELTWDDNDPSAHSDRWDTCFRLRCCVSADERGSSGRGQHPLHHLAAAQPERIGPA